MRFEVFTTVKIQVEFWLVTRYNVVVGYQRFSGPCCLHLYYTLKMEAAWTFENPTTTKITRFEFMSLDLENEDSQVL
jgi:hypothetical protein